MTISESRAVAPLRVHLEIAAIVVERRAVEAPRRRGSATTAARLRKFVRCRRGCAAISTRFGLAATPVSTVGDPPVSSTSTITRSDDGPMPGIFCSVPSGPTSDSSGSSSCRIVRAARSKALVFSRTVCTAARSCRSAPAIALVSIVTARPTMLEDAVDIPQTIGRYRIQAHVSSDAKDAVYAGFDPLIERPVAIKVFRFRIDDAAAIARVKQTFYREMQRIGALIHPNIVTLYDAGEIAGRALHRQRVRRGAEPGRAARGQLDARSRDARLDARPDGRRARIRARARHAPT